MENSKDQVILEKLGGNNLYQSMVERTGAIVQLYKAEGMSDKISHHLDKIGEFESGKDVQKVVEKWLKVEQGDGLLNKAKKATRSYETGVKDVLFDVHKHTTKGKLGKNTALLEKYASVQAEMVVNDIVLSDTYKNEVIQAMSSTIKEKDKQLEAKDVIIGVLTEKNEKLENKVYSMNDKLFEFEKEIKDLKAEKRKEKEKGMFKGASDFGK